MADCPQQDIAPEYQTTGYSWASLRALEQAMTDGTQLVRLNGRTIQFHSVSQMILLRDDMRKSLNSQSEQVGCRRPRAIKYRFSR